MPLTLLLLLLVAGASIVASTVMRHYVLALVLLIFSLYEISGPLVVTLFSSADLVLNQAMFETVWSEDLVESYSTLLLVLVLLANLSYGLSAALSSGWKPDPQPEVGSRFYYPLLVVLLIFGLISLYVGAGERRLLDYAGVEPETFRVFSYGGLLLTPAAVVAIHALARRDWSFLIVLAACISPLAYESFLTSRRQLFAPAILIGILYTLYATRGKRKAILLASLAAVTLPLLGLQYWVRTEFTQGQQATGLVDLLLPLLGEFVAVGAISITAWDRYVLADEPMTYGFHWLFHALNSFPFLKFGDLFFPEYRETLVGAYSSLAPWGGLSMVADALLALGIPGVVLFAIAAGALTYRCHSLLQRYLSRTSSPSIMGVYAVSFIGVLISKYRSGLGDAMQYLIAFTILYFSLVLLCMAIQGRADSNRLRSSARTVQ